MSKTKRLSGKRVVVTRSAGQNERLRGMLLEEGAEVVEVPLIRVVPDANREAVVEVFSELGSYDWVVFTSVNGVRCFFDVAFRAFEDVRSLGLLRFACLGEAEAAEIQRHHIKVECMGEVPLVESLAEALVGTGSLDNAKVIVVTGNRNRPLLVELLEKKGQAIVDLLPLYRTETVEKLNEAAAGVREIGADAILLMSASAVESLAGHWKEGLKLGAGARRPLLGSIGEVTSARLKELGFEVGFEAERASERELVEALCRRIAEG